MFREQTTRFLFKAHAVGASGTFTKPHAEFLEAQASCSLSIDGGKASARVENFNYRDIVSFRAAFTQAIGTFDPVAGSWNTFVTATVEGLNIQHVVTADRIVARLASHHFVDPQREASILTLGSHFENLKVAGQLVSFEPDSKIMKDWSTMSDARKEAKDRQPFSTSKDGSLILTSIGRVVDCAPGLVVKDNAIQFSEFGTIHLGEIIISEGERRLTMMRVEFGCTTDGSGNFGEAGGNGHTYP
jgi:hypothetical protein